MHLETITFSATAPGAAGATATAATGDSLVIKNSNGAAEIIAIWGDNQGAGFHQLTFPSGHDTSRGFRYNVPIAEPDNRLTLGLGMKVEPQETITATIAGSGTAGDVEIGMMLVHYGTLPGVTSRMITYAELERRAHKYTTISATLSGTAAGYTGTELVTAESDLLQANRDYALMGITTNTGCAGVWLAGPDTGYQRVSVPGNELDSQHMQEWFPTLSRAFDRALIPVINSGNKSATNIGFVQNENNVSPLVTLYLALLSRG
jgi:hypothetical protein